MQNKHWCVFAHCVGLLDDRAVSDWVRERDTKFNDIGAAFLHCEQHRYGVISVRKACSYKSDKRRDALCTQS